MRRVRELAGKGNVLDTSDPASLFSGNVWNSGIISTLLAVRSSAVNKSGCLYALCDFRKDEVGGTIVKSRSNIGKQFPANTVHIIP